MPLECMGWIFWGVMLRLEDDAISPELKHTGTKPGDPSCAYPEYIGAGMISGALLQSLCPAPGACLAQLGGAPPAVAPLSGQELSTGLKAAGTAMGGSPLQPCDGRTMWLIIGLITLTSPIAIFLTQVSRRTTVHRLAAHTALCAVSSLDALHGII